MLFRFCKDFVVYVISLSLEFEPLFIYNVLNISYDFDSVCIYVPEQGHSYAIHLYFLFYAQLCVCWMDKMKLNR